MPRPASTTGADGLPLWDTFEASFFLLAGLTMGIVLGILFPSAWRTVRRRLRNINRFAPQDDTLRDVRLAPRPGFHSVPDVLQGGGDGPEREANLELAEAFVLARYQLQEHLLREAVKTYLSILAHEQVSKRQTNQALFEISQVYSEMGLQDRAFDTALELFSRKPDEPRVFEYLVDCCIRFARFDRLRSILQINHTKPNAALRMRTSHALCELAERQLRESKPRDALETAREAVSWHVVSGRAKILLWRITGDDLWARAGDDARTIWMALATDLEARWRILRDTGTSPAAGAEHLGSLIAHVSAIPEPLQAYEKIATEFQKVSGRARLDSGELREFESLIWFAIVELTGRTDPFSDKRLRDVACALSDECCRFLASQSNAEGGLTKQRFGILRAAFRLHRCRDCGATSESHEWRCRQCGRLETLNPVFAALPD